MKKILSLVLAALLLFSMIPTAMAADTNPASEGTTISVTGTKGATYEVTVPATLSPGQTGTVTASGTWAANQTLTVTCPTSVNLVNGSDTIPVSVEFGGIAEAGNDNGDAENATANITVGNVDMSAYFGTWTGHLSYTVELVTDESAAVAMYSYNGVELPDINTVWTDELKAEYPYAVICYVYSTDVYILFLAQNRPYFYTEHASFNNCVFFDNSQRFKHENGTWNFYTEGQGYIIEEKQDMTWSSFDILNIDDNSVYLAASDPVPVS